MLRPFLLATACLASVAPHAVMAAPVSESDGLADIIVTATKRATRLSDVPIAVSAATSESMELTGANDIRQLNQISPALFVSSTSSEASGTAARIRGIGTIGDNPGLEASVPVFIDGVYRPRSGVALTELGDVERVEVLRGPQGTLFGRNTSAGLINIVTAKPSFEPLGKASLTYGNYDYWRVTGSVTGAVVADKLAAMIDGAYETRKGFIKDVISDRRINNRDRFLIRGQLLFTPTDNMSFRLIADYTKRDEECCVGPYLPFRTTTRDANGSLHVAAGNPVADLLKATGSYVSDDTWARKVGLTPGRSFRSNVKDWGVSGELDWDLGAVRLTSITSWRDWKVDAQQDADFIALDLMVRNDFDKRFRIFSEELRLNGTLFDDRLDWLVGAYYAHEKLDSEDDLHFGNDYMAYADAVTRLGNPAFPGYDALATMIGQPGDTLNGRGGYDTFRHTSRNYAFFTHNIFRVTERLSLTLGGRYTNERKTLDAAFRGNNTLCGGILASPDPAIRAASPLACIINPLAMLDGTATRDDDEFTGTVVLSYKPIPELMLYGSYARGYKAGGFNLDRAGLDFANVTLESLKFAPEKVDSFEIGAKLNLDQFRLNVAAFRTVYDGFQLNTYNGKSFIVENIESCKSALQPDGSCAAGETRGGVTATGIEIEAGVTPVANLAFDLGMNYTKTQYRGRLVGAGGHPLPSALVLLPGQQLSNAPRYVLTGGATWTPPINDMLGAIFHVDVRYQSGYNTGSDLAPEKWQSGYLLMNARIGVTGPEKRWSLELWAQNLLDTKYIETGFSTPLQGSGNAGVTALTGAPATTLFSGFLGEPRTYGVTVRTKF